jgi:hypothetical protein
MTIDIESRLSPEDLTNRIGAFGKDWRESKIPSEMRRKGVVWCGGSTEGRSFVLRLQITNGFGAALYCTGAVLPSEVGSRVLAKTITTRDVLELALGVLLGSPLLALLVTVRSFAWSVFLTMTLQIAIFLAGAESIRYALSRRLYERHYRTILKELAS